LLVINSFIRVRTMSGMCGDDLEDIARARATRATASQSVRNVGAPGSERP
jgi:hypothetical protein